MTKKKLTTQKLNDMILPIDGRFVQDQYTATHLIDTILELIEIEPNEKNWTFKYLKKYQPAFVRLQYIVAIAEVLLPNEINESIFKKENKKSTNTILDYETWVLKSLCFGSFIFYRNMEFYKNSNALKPYLECNDTTKSKVPKIKDLHHVQMVFHMLLSYKKQIMQVLNFYKNIHEGNAPLVVMMELAQPIEKTLYEQQQTLNQILSHIVNPNITTITLKTLQQKYHLPNMILEELDFEWL